MLAALFSIPKIWEHPIHNGMVKKTYRFSKTTIQMIPYENTGICLQNNVKEKKKNSTYHIGSKTVQNCIGKQRIKKITKININMVGYVCYW